MPASTEVLTCAEAAERLRISQKLVYRLVSRGELPALRFGRAIRIPVAGLERLIADAAASSHVLDADSTTRVGEGPI